MLKPCPAAALAEQAVVRSTDLLGYRPLGHRREGRLERVESFCWRWAAVDFLAVASTMMATKVSSALEADIHVGNLRVPK